VRERPVIAVAFIRPDYRSALEQAGADVREIAPDSDPLPAALDGVDGVLLTGGLDVAPSFYGETEQHPTVEVAYDRDDYELALARLALHREMPLLAICRGAQVLNVAAGGTLIQDIPSEHASSISHTVTEPRDAIAHDVAVTPGSTLASLLASRLDEAGRVPVNSRHHQAVKQLAPGFSVSATAPDGIIEAIEKAGGQLCLGVQWHPENFWRTGEFEPLFRALVDRARQAQQ
jgi:putative glutamine amidotransferase